MIGRNGLVDIGKHPLLKQCYEISLAIENLESSENATKATSLVSNFLSNLNDYISHINELNDEYDRDEYRIFKDGSAWCATRGGFVNLQESPAGFGETPSDALNELQMELALTKKAEPTII